MPGFVEWTLGPPSPVRWSSRNSIAPKVDTLHDGTYAAPTSLGMDDRHSVLWVNISLPNSA
eukprot:CAMPEP_0113578652 /NCGR_PEP_ID=MMETSP0015_2-20120614/29611_1 /TAXON_ID=2838 /ORGANISM="Odontella" /LENGTH=60 /DNA_ID=CAMNT_0000482503 /DNA_START=372 /DNA_END=554 /DNA_ORIENTATION=+ /assembly_acc=CAM_ASM_000160